MTRMQVWMVYSDGAYGSSVADTEDGHKPDTSPYNEDLTHKVIVLLYF